MLTKIIREYLDDRSQCTYSSLVSYLRSQFESPVFDSEVIAVLDSLVKSKIITKSGSTYFKNRI